MISKAHDELRKKSKSNSNDLLIKSKENWKCQARDGKLIGLND